jgi:hypothetical protein
MNKVVSSSLVEFIHLNVDLLIVHQAIDYSPSNVFDPLVSQLTTADRTAIVAVVFLVYEVFYLLARSFGLDFKSVGWFLFHIGIV